MDRRFAMIAALAVALTACGKSSEPVRATGSSTIYPFTRVVADAFVQANAGRPRPVIVSTGTGPGFRAFCAGVGGDTPDIADASRRMKKAEFDQCLAHGVKEIVEVRFGLDGIALAESNQGPKLELTRKDIYLALAANPSGKPNAARTWRDVNPRLPAIPIKVLGPPPGSGTRDLFVDQLLEPGCFEAVPAARQMQTSGDPAVFDRMCRQLRADGAYVAEGENDTVTVRGIERDPQAVGVFGYSYLERNGSRLRGVPIDGVAPDNASISAGRYPGGRTLYLYIKKQNLKDKPDLQAFLDLYATMWNPNGPLAKIGLIVMSDGARETARQAVADGILLDREQLF